MMRGLLLLAAFLFAAAGALHAQSRGSDRLPDGDPSRFSFHRIDNGFVRLDLRSGEVSFCTLGKNGWECLATADDRSAYEAEISRLQAENATLKKALLDRGLSLPKGTTTAPPLAQKPTPDAKAPSDAEVDRVMTVIERIWRRLVEMMVSLQRDLNKT